MVNRLWTRWKRFAHRAAEVQSHVLLALLYWIVVAPIGAVQRLAKGHRTITAPSWTPRQTKDAVTLEDARRQF
jgi:hypothetical protein